MKKLFLEILNRIDKKQLFNDIERLWQLELPQTSTAHKNAAAYVLELLKRAGIKSPEIINFPADGKTVYHDKRMPLAWDASVGRLSIIDSPVPFGDNIVADYEKHPFSLIKGSVSTPPGGRIVRIITEVQLFAGENPQDALIICDSDTPPGAKILKAVLDMGGLGIISDHYAQKSKDAYPEAIAWVTACTEGSHWHVQEEDRPFIAFSVSPIVGDRLRNAAAKGALTAKVESDGKRYAGVIPAVTALLPGRQDKELWVMAHLYEPLSDDNSTGVTGAIEIVRVIKEMIAEQIIGGLEFSIRLVFASEMYGFAAFADRVKTHSRGKVIGAINLDSLMSGNPGQELNIFLAPPESPFFGNSLLEILVDECDYEVSGLHENGAYSDDMCLSDKTVGIPCIWAIGQEKQLWHNSALTMEIIDMRIFSRICAFLGTWIAYTATLNFKNKPEIIIQAGAYAVKHLEEESRFLLRNIKNINLRSGMDIPTYISERINYRMQIDLERLDNFSSTVPQREINKQKDFVKQVAEILINELKKNIPADIQGNTAYEKWFDYSKTIIPKRITVGLPYDQVKAPKSTRRELPDNVIYGAFANILSNMDGEKTLQRLILEAEWNRRSVFSESQIKKNISSIMHLGDCGYLEVNYKSFVTKDEIISALKSLGLGLGDCIFVHSALSALGRIEGGADTVIDAIKETAGEEGTLIFPAFTQSSCYFDKTSGKNLEYRPFDKNDPSQIWTGKLPQCLCGRKDVFRSAHPTHSVFATGRLAEEITKYHHEEDSPAGVNSPLAKLLELKGKILYLGSGLGASTFLHFIEDHMNVSYLEGAVCKIKERDNSIRTIYLNKHLPGDRDFYHEPALKCKFFKEAVKNGLIIKKTSLGLGELFLIDAEELFKTGKTLLRKNPTILLCDSSECTYCCSVKKKDIVAKKIA